MNNRSGRKSWIPGNREMQTTKFVSPTNLTKRQLPIGVVAIRCDRASEDNDLGLFPAQFLRGMAVIRESPSFAPRGVKDQPISGESSVHGPVLIAHQMLRPGICDCFEHLTREHHHNDFAGPYRETK